MRLVVEASEEEFEAIVSNAVVIGRLTVVEVRQAGGLLSAVRPVRGAEVVSNFVSEDIGLGDGPGPGLRVYVAREEE